MNKKIMVGKSHFKKLQKIRETLNLAGSLMQDLPPALRREIRTSEVAGFSLESSLHRAIHCAESLTDKVEVK